LLHARALLGRRYPKPNVNHLRFHGDFCTTWIHQAYEILSEDQNLLFSSSPDAQSCTLLTRVYRTQQHALKVASVVARCLEAHGFEFRSHEPCGNFMSTLPCFAALKQVIRKEPRIRANRFRSRLFDKLGATRRTQDSVDRQDRPADPVTRAAHPKG